MIWLHRLLPGHRVEWYWGPYKPPDYMQQQPYWKCSCGTRWKVRT